MPNTCADGGPKHPSGLSWARWRWPFKTSEEMRIVARWFKKQPVTGEEALF